MFGTNGCGEGNKDEAKEISELTSLGGGGIVPPRGGDGLDDSLEPT